LIGVLFNVPLFFSPFYSAVLHIFFPGGFRRRRFIGPPLGVKEFSSYSSPLLFLLHLLSLFLESRSPSSNFTFYCSVLQKRLASAFRVSSFFLFRSTRSNRRCCSPLLRAKRFSPPLSFLGLIGDSTRFSCARGVKSLVRYFQTKTFRRVPPPPKIS